MLLKQLFEQTGKTAVVAFGRMNPPTIGHLKLIAKMRSIPGDHLLFLSHSQDPKQNPLSFQEKQMFAKNFFPGVIVGNESVKTPMNMMSFLEQHGYTDIIYIAGSDRVEDFDKLLNTYNGKLYNFNSIQIVNAGERDPDADGAEGMSASKMRAAVASDNFEAFKQGVPNKELAQQMFDAVKAGMAAAPIKKSSKKKPESLSEQFNHSFNILCEDIDFFELNRVEKIADALWKNLGVDVKFTRHFFDRVNDERNRIPITPDELIDLFKKEYQKYGKVIANSKDEAVMKDILTKINLPFAINTRGDSKQLVAKTVMRKSNFLTPNHVYAVSEKSDKKSHLDPEFDKDLRYASSHYSGYSDDPQMAFNKYVDRNIILNKKTDKSQDDQLSKLKKQIDTLKNKLDQLSTLPESMLPKSAFAGSNKNKLGPAAHLKGKMKRAAKQGDLVGSMESVASEAKSKAIGKTAKDLSNPPKIMQHRAKRDQERERQYSGSQLAKRDTTSKDVWGDYKEDWQKVNKHDRTDGMSSKAVKAYRKENPGSKLQTAVTTKPSSLKKGSKDAKRRDSFCARMSGMKKTRASDKTKKDPNSPINKALKRWNCNESVNQNTSLNENIENIMCSLIEKILTK